MARPRTPTSPLFVLVTAVVVVGALYFAKEVFLPLALAVMLSFLLTPMANRLERWGLPRIPAVLGVASFAFAVMGVLIWIMTLQAMDLGAKLQTYQGNIVAKIRAVKEGSGPISNVADTLDKMGKAIQEKAVNSPNSGSEQPGGTNGLPVVASPTQKADENSAVAVKVIETPTLSDGHLSNWVGPVLSPLGTAGLVVVLVIFMLVDREDQRNRFIQLFGTSNLHVTTEALTDAAARVSRYLRMQFMINAGYGVCVAIALTVIGVPNALMWGVLGFMLRFLPYIGPVLSAAMPIAVSAAVSSGWTQPLLVIGWFVVLELVVNNVVEPWIYGSTVGISAVGIIISAIFWTWLWGPIGLVLAMPLTVCLVVLANYVPQLRFVSVLLGDQPALSDAERTYQRLLAMDDLEIRKVARTHLKESTLAEYYDDVLIPALSLAERDRHNGLLNDEQEAFVHETAEDLLEELPPKSDLAAKPAQDEEAAAALAARQETRVLCIPLRDKADQTTTVMLSQLLRAEGFTVDVGSVDSLTSELVDEVAELGSQIVVISILPPCSPRNSRLLYQRLHRRYPNIRVIIGYWNALPDEHLRQRFELESPDRLVTSLAEGVDAVRQSAAALRVIDSARPGSEVGVRAFAG